MLIPKFPLYGLMGLIIISISACAQNQFIAFNSPDVNSQPKTPGYYNPNDHYYAMPQNQQPVVENKFYWKNSPDTSAIEPGDGADIPFMQ